MSNKTPVEILVDVWVGSLVAWGHLVGELLSWPVALCNEVARRSFEREEEEQDA